MSLSQNVLVLTIGFANFPVFPELGNREMGGRELGNPGFDLRFSISYSKIVQHWFSTSESVIKKYPAFHHNLKV